MATRTTKPIKTAALTGKPTQWQTDGTKQNKTKTKRSETKEANDEEEDWAALGLKTFPIKTFRVLDGRVLLGTGTLYLFVDGEGMMGTLEHMPQRHQLRELAD